MSQFIVNANGALDSGNASGVVNVNSNNTGIWGQLLLGLTTIRTEVVSLRDSLVLSLRNQFSFNGGITNTLANRFRYEFPSLQALPVGIFIQDVTNNSSITGEQIAFFNTVSIRVLIATGRRLKVISQDRTNIFYIRLTVDLDAIVGAVSNLRVTIESDDTNTAIITANSVIFLEFFNDLPLV